MMLIDFQCDACSNFFEDLVDSKDREAISPCCGARSVRVIISPTMICKTIIPTYPKCKRQKAGYTHTTHADQPATRIQSGYGGCSRPPS